MTYLLGHETYEADVDGESIAMVSDTVIALPVDGEPVEIWSARESLWDDLYPVILQMLEQGQERPLDWTHGTTIAFDERNDRLLVTLTKANSVVGINRLTGVTSWVLGGNASTLTVGVEQGTLVAVPHSIQALDGSVLLFNQQFDRDGEHCGEATEVALDVPDSSASLAWWGREPDCGAPDIMGSAYRMLDGGTLMAGGTLGRLSWLDTQGEQVWRLEAELGTTFGGTSHVADFH